MMLLRALAALLLPLLVLGCANPREPERVRLVFRHSRMPGDSDPLPALLAEFERLHPGVRVAHEPLPWTADVQHQFFVLNLEGRSAGFDVLMLDVIWVPEFARPGWLLDLTERWPAADRSEHFPAGVTAATLAGRVWAVPWVTNVGLLYYRRVLLARHGLRPPRSYDELARQAAAILARERDPTLGGFVWQGKQYEGLVVNVLESFWEAGTDLPPNPPPQRRLTAAGDRGRRGAEPPRVRRGPRRVPAQLALRRAPLRSSRLGGTRAGRARGVAGRR